MTQFDGDSFNEIYVVNIKHINILSYTGRHPWKCAGMVACIPSICKLDQHVDSLRCDISQLLFWRPNCII